MDRSGCAGVLALMLLAALAAPADLDAQARRTPSRRVARTPPPPPPPTIEPAVVTCPQVLGPGVKTARSFCDVLIGRDPADGVLIPLPPHTGPVTLRFDLHNRHTYSDDQIKAKRAYHRYTATVGVMAMDNTLLARAVVQSEFRNAADLVDRVTGGVGPGGVKAVAPTGTEPIEIVIPEEETQVSLLGEKLSVVRVDGDDNFLAAGRPIAVVSNVQLEYTPAPPAPATRKPAINRR